MGKRRAPLLDLSWVAKVWWLDVACRWMSQYFPLAPDAVELKFQLEKAFGITLDDRGFDGVSGWGGNSDVAAGSLFDWVTGQSKSAGRPLRRGDWRRFSLALPDVCGIDPRSIHRDSLLNRDLKLYKGG